MIGIIACVSRNGVIGCGGKIPWHYPEDLKYFRETTKNSTIIMGRKTFESIGKPLPNRRNIVISSRPIDMPNVEVFSSISDVRLFSSPVWFIGGSSIYEAGMEYADEIHLTIVPDIIKHKDAIRFPWINPELFEVKEKRYLDNDNKLYLNIYKKII